MGTTDEDNIPLWDRWSAEERIESLRERNREVRRRLEGLENRTTAAGGTIVPLETPPMIASDAEAHRVAVGHVAVSTLYGGLGNGMCATLELQKAATDYLARLFDETGRPLMKFNTNPPEAT